MGWKHCRHRDGHDVMIFQIRISPHTFHTVSPWRHSQCCTWLYIQKVTKVAVWGMTEESLREIKSCLHLANQSLSATGVIGWLWVPMSERLEVGSFRCCSTIQQALWHTDTFGYCSAWSYMLMSAWSIGKRIWQHFVLVMVTDEKSIRINHLENICTKFDGIASNSS